MAFSSSSTSLGATYSSSVASQTKEFAHQIPAATTPTDHLSALRSATVKLQDELNMFLTQKMEEDKAAAGTGGKAVDDAKEEENYGEEVVDED